MHTIFIYYPLKRGGFKPKFFGKFVNFRAIGNETVKSLHLRTEELLQYLQLETSQINM
ncbi:MAG: hypothetical protein F6K40_16570 [Okeania sp. SIO3I5]|uniref:hypothetical protein n=1 Tax=Okeania sp. SIO3I5 TaxID=2607805 RepID=UPI0013BAE1D0|nr:hypothetical protein [Okeania sp. SIO3I5]NEQ37784.1 hypothetical protein [Okeania sp. SIO3I5]